MVLMGSYMASWLISCRDLRKMSSVRIIDMVSNLISNDVGVTLESMSSLYFVSQRHETLCCLRLCKFLYTLMACYRKDIDLGIAKMNSVLTVVEKH